MALQGGALNRGQETALNGMFNGFAKILVGKTAVVLTKEELRSNMLSTIEGKKVSLSKNSAAVAKGRLTTEIANEATLKQYYQVIWEYIGRWEKELGSMQYKEGFLDKGIQRPEGEAKYRAILLYVLAPKWIEAYKESLLASKEVKDFATFVDSHFSINDIDKEFKRMDAGVTMGSAQYEDSILKLLKAQQEHKNKRTF